MIWANLVHSVNLPYTGFLRVVTKSNIKKFPEIRKHVEVCQEWEPIHTSLSEQSFEKLPSLGWQFHEFLQAAKQVSLLVEPFKKLHPPFPCPEGNTFQFWLRYTAGHDQVINWNSLQQPDCLPLLYKMSENNSLACDLMQKDEEPMVKLQHCS